MRLSTRMRFSSPPTARNTESSSISDMAVVSTVLYTQAQTHRHTGTQIHTHTHTHTHTNTQTCRQTVDTKTE